MNIICIVNLLFLASGSEQAKTLVMVVASVVIGLIIMVKKKKE